MPTYRGRLAPSPTGLLHLGHAGTFIIAAKRARAAGGTLILRNDDLDQQRARPKFYRSMMEDLRWLGIGWREGPDIGGLHQPYSQSERGARYLAVWRRLAAAGWLYPCHCSRRELASVTLAPHEAEDGEPIYPGTCRPEHPNLFTGDNPGPVNWRFRVPEGVTVTFKDGHFGPQTFVAGHDFGDFLVWRRDGVASYQLACVADDAAMGITEVVRGADLLKSTARQILLYRALDLEPPAWFHCPLITDENGVRLAKRHDALSIRALREQGRTPEEVASMAGCPTSRF